MMSDKICLFTDLPMSRCPHCRGDDDLVYIVDETPDYEVVARFETQFKGTCIINHDHAFRRGDIVAKVQLADNPMIPVSGVVCKNCLKTLPRAKK
jgi:hypothetical protein